MDTEVVVALIGLPVTALGAAIAYPVGRAVARRQAADQHAQWLRTERRNATRAYSDVTAKFIEELRSSWEQVGRPEYAHTRRRDIELRKRLDPALYEPLKQALGALHSAGAVVALHGPDGVIAAAEDVYGAALAATSHLLRFDASNVCRSIQLSSMKQGDSSHQHLQAALEDLDRAFARLAAPLGLPEYPAEIETTLRSAAAVGAAVQLLRSLSEPGVARAAMLDLRHSLEDADEETRQWLSPVLALEPLVEFSALAVAIQAGEPIDPEHFFSLVGTAMPALVDLYSGVQDQSGMLRDLWAELEPDQDPVLDSAVEAATRYTENLNEPMQILQQLQQHFERAQELVTTEVPPVAAVEWASGLHPLTASLHASAARSEALLPLLGEAIRPLFDRSVDEAAAMVRCELDRVISEHSEFLERAREAIDLP